MHFFRQAPWRRSPGGSRCLPAPGCRDCRTAAAAFVIPGLLSVAYAGLILAFWSGAAGGFDSLDNVALLFQSRELLLAGWLHYLAFDLFVGAWEVRTARAERMPFFLVVPCLALTFLFGPVGFLLFLMIRTVRAQAARPATTHAF